ncbi:EAL domain-containing protein [Lentilactobacillus kisonensis]|uniref:Cyclic diguanylate phosphodiesterase domain protein n=2 Tax=Lentilactobacillus kisonensis TaxID=481722 RepID=H1LGS4_9LACO|nr:EAL domain-containing protein [Lentilactobacillus kisonensis]EHO50827.1 cyclic diguanylate phosphodiesterase domain protein [Lentilactobacillus kisonensis F0435]KRL20591.1 cyclic diguanylate phosphodiesterase domain protein [Lentilactobacillus kisonensis DSM 19906 = JCM 15041]
MYRYFIQPQVNVYTNSIIGYEMLIRKQAGDGTWRLPKNFASIPIEIQINLLKRTAEELSLKVHTLSFNVNRTQFLDKKMTQALIDAQRQMFPVILVVEVTEELGEDQIDNPTLEAQGNHLQQYGIQMSLDDVDTGENTYSHISDLLKTADEVKFAMQNFRQEHREKEIPRKLTAWKKISKDTQTRLIIEGTENSEEDQLLNELELPLRQGYYYGKPRLFRFKNDPR